MKVLVCGSRHFQDKVLMGQVLEMFDIDHIIEGGAPGADTLAKEWAFAHNVAVTEYMADWERYGRAAGPIRNRRMLAEGVPDLVVAFLARGSRGTKNMILQADKLGVKTHIVDI